MNDFFSSAILFCLWVLLAFSYSPRLLRIGGCSAEAAEAAAVLSKKTYQSLSARQRQRGFTLKPPTTLLESLEVPATKEYEDDEKPSKFKGSIDRLNHNDREIKGRWNENLFHSYSFFCCQYAFWEKIAMSAESYSLLGL